MKVQDYSIVEQLRKTRAQISLLSLLIHSDEHRRALMKILNEAHVPNKISVNHLEKIANKIFEVNRITFSNDELLVEGTEHNKALYLTVKCEDSVVTKVICVRGFDGGGKDSVGDIVLELTIGPEEFTIEFQVLEIAFSYNFSLGRPWIHAAKAVPSTLHQIVKFEWDRQEIAVHGEENLCAHSDASVSFIKAKDDKGPWVYQVFETVLVEKVPEGKCIPTPKIASASVMVASEMLKNSFAPADVKRAKRLKQKVWALSKPILHLSRSFVKSGARKPSVTTVPSSVVDIDEELIERFQRLFDDMNMVEVREECNDESEYDEDETFEEIRKELNHFEGKPKPNLNETESINLGDPDNLKETKISVHLEPQIREEIIKALLEYKDIFAWSYDDMSGLSTDLVVHKLPIDPAFPPIKQKLRMFKTDMSVKIKEEVTKQLDAKFIRVARYPTWLANVVHVPKKDSKTIVCVDYRDLNKASPKDNFPLPNIHILIDNCAKHEIGSFVDCYAGYH
ncbi:uncharacterized protein [Nicotiana sylvestris]|uniref:uncharacterized protein n=1 Tax=Nicotiana sylvestris TaxID=4096 RepID=UPI00388C7755